MTLRVYKLFRDVKGRDKIWLSFVFGFEEEEDDCGCDDEDCDCEDEE